LACAGVQAQDAPGSFARLAGEWKLAQSHDQAAALGLKPGQDRQFMARLEEIASLWRAMPVFSPPLGFQARARSEYLRPNEPCGGCPVQARLALLFYYFTEGADGKPVWGGEANTSLELRVNDPLHALSSTYSLWYGGLAMADGREIHTEPPETGRIAGHPLYHDDLLVFSRNGAPCWVPVTRGQFLDALISLREAEYRKHAADLGAAKDPYQTWLAERPARQAEQAAALRHLGPAQAEAMRAQFRQLEAGIEAGLRSAPAAPGIAALAPLKDFNERLRAERAGLGASAAQPAWYRNPEAGASGLVAAGSPGAVPLVAVNPAWADRSRPGSEFQLITVLFYFEGSSPANLGNQRLREFLTSADWGRIAARVQPAAP
jgi:hypothetical protein